MKSKKSMIWALPAVLMVTQFSAIQARAEDPKPQPDKTGQYVLSVAITGVGGLSASLVGKNVRERNVEVIRAKRNVDLIEAKITALKAQHPTMGNRATLSSLQDEITQLKRKLAVAVAEKESAKAGLEQEDQINRLRNQGVEQALRNGTHSSSVHETNTGGMSAVEMQNHMGSAGGFSAANESMAESIHVQGPGVHNVDSVEVRDEGTLASRERDFALREKTVKRYEDLAKKKGLAETDEDVLREQMARLDTDYKNLKSLEGGELPSARVAYDEKVAESKSVVLPTVAVASGVIGIAGGVSLVCSAYDLASWCDFGNKPTAAGAPK